MTTLNIPSSPSQGATYEANGVVYTWDGTKWKADSSYVSNLNGGQLGGFRNQLINGDFNVFQRATDGTATADNTYVSADRWMAGLGCRLVQRNDKATVCPGFGSGLTFYPAANRDSIYQGIELVTPGNAGPYIPGSSWTLSLWATSPMSAQVGFSTGTFHTNETLFMSGSMVSTGETRVNGSQTYTRYSLTTTLQASSVPSATNNCISVKLILPAGPTLVLLAGVQFEPGPVATPFEHRPIGTELALCQRYYQNFLAGGFYIPAINATQAYGFFPKYSPQRISGATCTVSGTYFSGNVGTSIPSTASAIDRVDTVEVRTGSLTNFNGFQNVRITADAEL